MVIRKPAKREVTRKRSPRKAEREPNVFERIAALAEHIPAEERANFPTDSARNLDNYLYGSPKRG